MPNSGRILTAGLALIFGLIAAIGMLGVGWLLILSIGYDGWSAALAWIGLALLIVLGVVGLRRWRDADLRDS